MTLKTLALIGFLLSFYAFHIRRKSLKQKYKPLCDISKNISCTKALTSPHGKLIGISNSTLGLIFYPLIFILAYLNLITSIFYLSLLALLASLYLAYISYYKLRTLCLVCTSIYLVNILLLIFSY